MRKKNPRKYNTLYLYELFLGYLSVKMLIVYFLSEISYLGNVLLGWVGGPR